jgi:hypothetical protein
MNLKELQTKFPCFGRKFGELADCKMCPNPSLCRDIKEHPEKYGVQTNAKEPTGGK